MTKLLRGLSSLLQLVVLLVGPPLALAWFAGWPLPRHWPTSEQWTAALDNPLTGTVVIDAVACLMWLLWAGLVYLLIRDIATRLGTHRARRPRWRLAAPLHTVASSLIGSTVLAITSITSRGTTLTAGPPGGAAAPVSAGALVTTVATAPTAAPVPSGQLMVLTAGQHYTYTVRHGDTLWHVAGTWLGDPHRWREVYQLNRDRYDQHGRMRHGDHIEPGWLLVLPDDATPPPSATPVAPPTTPNPPGPVPASPTPAAPPPTGPGPTPDDGGTAAPAAPTGPAMGATPAASSARPAPAADNAPPRSGEHGGIGVDLGEHGWLAAPTAAGVAAAAALVWIHRRRRYRPRPPGPVRRTDPDLTPLPSGIAALHRAHTDTASEDDMDQSAPEAHQAATVTAATLGVHGETTVGLPDLPGHGLGLDGPGASAAARGVLAAVLSAGGPWAPGDEAMIITTVADLTTLLGPDTAGQHPSDRLIVAPTLGDALTHAERHLLRRARIASQTSDDLTNPPEPEPDQPPIVILTAAPSGATATRLAAILAVGTRLGIGGILLGTLEGATTWHVNTDGTTRTDDGHDGPRLGVLDDATTTDILNTLREARPPDTDPEPTPPPLPEPASANGSRPVPATTAPPAPRHAEQGPGDPHPSGNPPAPTSTAARLRLVVLGRPSLRLIDGDPTTEVRIRRTDGLPILVYLAVNPDGATSDQLMAALWPEVRSRFSRKRFHTTMSELRTHLSETVGAETIPRTPGPYHLDPNHIDVDLWALNTTIDQAATALDPAEHLAALHRIIALYTGPIADGHSWLWLAPHREATRRHLLDAHVALAEGEPDPRRGLTIIQDAIRLDPYNEDLYQRAMHLHARLANPDGIRRTLRALSERLTELEIRVTPQTQQIATDLLHRLDLQQRARDSPP
jgi:DNA-binding SARP family transcriptional activator